jgi:hypothetical protein
MIESPTGLVLYFDGNKISLLEARWGPKNAAHSRAQVLRPLRQLATGSGHGDACAVTSGIEKEPDAIGLLLSFERFVGLVAVARTLAGEAVAAVDRLRAAGAEGDLGLAAAARAGCAEHLARAARIATL